MCLTTGLNKGMFIDWLAIFFITVMQPLLLTNMEVSAYSECMYVARLHTQSLWKAYRYSHGLLVALRTPHLLLK